MILAFAITTKANIVFAQDIFQKRSDLIYSYDEFSSVYPSDTGFLAIGQAISSIALDSTNHPPERRLTATWYNWSGDIVRQTYLVKNKTDYYGIWYGANMIAENCFYHFGGLDDSATTTFPNSGDIIAVKLNYQGDTVWTKRYDSGQFDTGTSGVVANNSDFVGIGCSRLPINGQIHSRIIRYDNLGNIIWDKTYNNNYGNRGNYIIKDNSHNFYIAGQANINNNTGSNPKNIRAMLLKIDSLGTQIWLKTVPGICNDYAGGIAFALDGNILMANLKCYDQPSGNAIRSRFSLYKLNIEGDTLWHKEYPVQYNNTEHPNFIRALDNGDILLGGEGLKLFYENGDTAFGKRTGVLIRTDSLGNMKWQHYYFYNVNDAANMVESYLSDGKQTPDGGFILVGRTTHISDFDDGWIIKTDENGCIDLSCVNGIEELDDEDFRLFIYPNPAEEYVSIDLPILYNNGTMQIYNMHGQLVKTAPITTGGTQNFTISNLSNGIYQLVVYSNTNKLLGREKLVVAR
jgi:hypothetical protein